MTIAEFQPRKAQERYAQQLLDYFNDGHILPDEHGKLFFEGSLVNLLKDLIPQAQYHEVVGRILVPSGAISRVYNACWQIHRSELYPDGMGPDNELKDIKKRITTLEQRLDDHVNRTIIHSRVEE